MESAPSDGPDRAFRQVMQAGGKSAGAQQHGKIFCALFGESAFNIAGIANFTLDVGELAYLVVEHHGKVMIWISTGFIVRCGEGAKFLAGSRRQVESNVRAAVGISAGAGITNISSAYDRNADLR